MKTNEAVRDRILRLCQEHDMTINRLATVSALPPSSIKNILYGKSRNPKLLTIKLICDGLGITLGPASTPAGSGGQGRPPLWLGSPFGRAVGAAD